MKNNKPSLDLNFFTTEAQTAVQNYICKICGGVYDNPHYDYCIQSGGHVYCHRCILTGYKCPITGEIFHMAKAVAVNTIQVIINNKNVYCLYKDTGCDWIDKLVVRASHLDVCPKAPTKCQFCNVTQVREYIDVHQNDCEYRIIPCEKCGDKTITKREKENHKNVCQMEEIECEKQCGVTVLRAGLKEHSKVCNNEIVKCEYSCYGCNFQCQRQYMSEHLHNNAELHQNNVLLEIVEMKKTIDNKFSEFEKNAYTIKKKLDQYDFSSLMHEDDITESTTERHFESGGRHTRKGRINYAEEGSEEIYDDPMQLRSNGGSRTNPIILSGESEFGDGGDEYSTDAKEYQYIFLTKAINHKDVSKWRVTVVALKPEDEFYTGVCVQEDLRLNRFKAIDLDDENGGIFGVSCAGVLIHGTQPGRNNTVVENFTIRQGDVINCEFDSTRMCLTMCLRNQRIKLEGIDSHIKDYILTPFFFHNKDPKIEVTYEMDKREII
jgi:hypothetical protein